MIGLGFRMGLPNGSASRYRKKWDFSVMAPGANPAPYGLGYTCATTDRYVQNSTSDGDLLISGIGQDQLSIGRWKSDLLYGLSLSPAITNLIGNPRTQATWGAASPGAGGSHVRDQAGVDGTANAAWYSDIKTAGDYSAYVQGFAHTANSWVSDYVRCPTASVGSSRSRIRPYRVTTGALSYPGSADDLVSGRALTDRWVAQRRNIVDASGVTAGYLACVSGIRAGQYASAMSPGNVQITDCPQWVAGKIPGEFHVGVRATDTLTIPSTALLTASGQVRLELAFYPKSSMDSHNILAKLLYLDANNTIQYNGISGGKAKVYIRSGGTIDQAITFEYGYTAPVYTDMVLTSVPLVRVYFECGGGAAYNRIWIKDGSSAAVLIHERAGTPAFAAGTYSVLSGSTTGMLGVHLVSMGILKAGQRPAWVV